MPEKKVNIRRSMVRRYNRTTAKAFALCAWLFTIGLASVGWLMESLFPPTATPGESSYYRATPRERLYDLLFEFPLEFLRWCGLPEFAIRIILVILIVACFGGISGVVLWTRRMRGKIPPAVKLEKTLK